MAVINTFNSTTWKKLAEDPSKSCVRLVNKKFHLSFPPFYVNDVRKSVMTVIEQRLIRYEADLGGILAGCGKISILGPKAEIMFNLSEIHVDVQGEFFIFNPYVGSQLTGVVNKKSVGHIGCLVHGLFNISLPKPFSMPAQSWTGSRANLHDEVTFTVTRADFQSQVPYIEGTVVDVYPYSDSSTTRERKTSDSGVSIGSDEAVSSQKPEETGKKLSFVKCDDSPTKPAGDAPNAVIAEKNTSPIPNKKRKHHDDSTQSATEPVADETPRKKSKPALSDDSDDDNDVMEIVGNLFAEVTKKVMVRGSTDKKKSKNAADISVDSIKSSGKKKLKREEIKNVKIKNEAESDEDIIKELMSSIHKSTPQTASAAKTSKKKLNMSQAREDCATVSTPKASQFRTEMLSPKILQVSTCKKNNKSALGDFDSESVSSVSSNSSKRSKKKEKINNESTEDIIKELMTSVHESTPIKDTPKVKSSSRKSSVSRPAEKADLKSPDTIMNDPSSNKWTGIVDTPTPNLNESLKSNKSSKSAKLSAVKSEPTPMDRKASFRESLLNSILKSTQKK